VGASPEVTVGQNEFCLATMMQERWDKPGNGKAANGVMRGDFICLLVQHGTRSTATMNRTILTAVSI
jgi:hypothetical protein